MTRTSHPRQLLVEGSDDRLVIQQLMEKLGVTLGTEEEPIVGMVVRDSVEQLLERDSIRTRIKGSGVEALGIICDANDELSARWQSLRDSLEPFEPFVALPATPPSEGFVAPTELSNRVGIWLMPDNQSTGMLETFLAQLVPDPQNDLWNYTEEVIEAARRRSASYKACHADKARIHSWLAWQDPPGRRLHTAVLKGFLDQTKPLAQRFLSWFSKLYDLPLPAQPPWG